jgi:hypothetical protein
VSGDRDHRDRRRLIDRRIHGDQALYAAFEKDPLPIRDAIGAVPVRGQQVRPSAFQQALFDAAQDQRGITFADLRHHHAHEVGAAGAQGPREIVRTVIEALGGGENAILGFLRDGGRGRRAVQYQR